MAVLSTLDDFIRRGIHKYMGVELQMLAYEQHFHSRMCKSCCWEIGSENEEKMI